MKFFFSLPILSQMSILYFVIINISTFFYFGIDKIKARIAARRVSERTLWALMLLGGSLGALLGMYYFRHKTQKASFQAVVVFILLLQTAMIFLFFAHV